MAIQHHEPLDMTDPPTNGDDPGSQSSVSLTGLPTGMPMNVRLESQATVHGSRASISLSFGSSGAWTAPGGGPNGFSITANASAQAQQPCLPLANPPAAYITGADPSSHAAAPAPRVGARSVRPRHVRFSAPPSRSAAPSGIRRSRGFYIPPEAIQLIRDMIAAHGRVQEDSEDGDAGQDSEELEDTEDGAYDDTNQATQSDTADRTGDESGDELYSESEDSPDDSVGSGSLLTPSPPPPPHPCPPPFGPWWPRRNIEDDLAPIRNSTRSARRGPKQDANMIDAGFGSSLWAARTATTRSLPRGAETPRSGRASVKRGDNKLPRSNISRRPGKSAAGSVVGGVGVGKSTARHGGSQGKQGSQGRRTRHTSRTRSFAGFFKPDNVLLPMDADGDTEMADSTD